MSLLLVGGGLANGLLALRLKAVRPELSVTLLEAGPSLGGNHTWSFHGTDVTPAQLEWLLPLCAKSWPAHDVRLPGVTRTLAGSYHSIRSEDFDRALRGPKVRLGCPVERVEVNRVVLASGEVLEAGAVIDGRGATLPFPAGFQKFLGLELELEAPHRLERPLLIDATVDQIDGFRFIYVLPWSERRVLVEDTVYSDTAELNLPALRARIERWVTAQGWKIKAVLREEAAALPIPLGGEAPRFDGARVGVGAGLFHATTGYSLPFAASTAELICALPQLDPVSLTTALNRVARRHWKGQAFFRLLNRMLFHGAEPSERVRIFSAFYRHDDGLISRFYAGRLTVADKLQALRRGAPTVPAMRALKAAASW